jgi:hypothetical protein
MGYHAERTPILIATLQREPERKFTASELKHRTQIPKKVVRRALTVDNVAEYPMDGVGMERDGERHWRFWWKGIPA